VIEFLWLVTAAVLVCFLILAFLKPRLYKRLFPGFSFATTAGFFMIAFPILSDIRRMTFELAETAKLSPVDFEHLLLTKSLMINFQVLTSLAIVFLGYLGIAVLLYYFVANRKRPDMNLDQALSESVIPAT